MGVPSIIFIFILCIVHYYCVIYINSLSSSSSSSPRSGPFRTVGVILRQCGSMKNVFLDHDLRIPTPSFTDPHWRQRYYQSWVHRPFSVLHLDWRISWFHHVSSWYPRCPNHLAENGPKTVQNGTFLFFGWGTAGAGINETRQNVLGLYPRRRTANARGLFKIPPMDRVLWPYL